MFVMVGQVFNQYSLAHQLVFPKPGTSASSPKLDLGDPSASDMAYVAQGQDKHTRMAVSCRPRCYPLVSPSSSHHPLAPSFSTPLKVNDLFTLALLMFRVLAADDEDTILATDGLKSDNCNRQHLFLL